MDTCGRHRETGADGEAASEQSFFYSHILFPWHDDRAVRGREQYDIRPCESHQLSKKQGSGDSIIRRWIESAGHSRVGHNRNFNFRIAAELMQHVITVRKHIKQQRVRACFNGLLRVVR